MKPRGRRRTFIEIIPERKGFMYDRARDIYLKLPMMKLTPEERESVGEFAQFKVTDGDPTHPDFFDEMIERIGRPREFIPRLRVLDQARNVFAILVRYGYPYQPYLALFDGALDEILRWLRRVMVRQLLIDRIDAADESEFLQFLSSQIENGQWPNWLEEIKEIESELCG